jgi:hypothetical protein
MLRVTVELWQGGDETRARPLAIANVANVSHLADVSDYAVNVSEGYNPLTATRPCAGTSISTIAKHPYGRSSQRSQTGQQRKPARPGDDSSRRRRPPLDTGGHRRRIA